MPEEKIQIAQGQHDTPAKKEQQLQQQFEQALNTLMKFVAAFLSLNRSLVRLQISVRFEKQEETAFLKMTRKRNAKSCCAKLTIG